MYARISPRSPVLTLMVVSTPFPNILSDLCTNISGNLALTALNSSFYSEGRKVTSETYASANLV